MKNYANANGLKDTGIKPHQILVASTSEPDYEMYRQILLVDVDGLEYGEYLLLEGGHCSCYDFDETDWHGTIYTKGEPIKLAEADYNENDVFWKQVLEQM